MWTACETDVVMATSSRTGPQAVLRVLDTINPSSEMEKLKLQVTITGRHLELDDEVKQYVQKRLKTLKRFFDEIMSINVVLGKEKHRETAEITIQVSGVTIHGEEETSNLYSSIDLVVGKIEKQIRKHKDRLVGRRRRGRGDGGQAAMRYRIDVLSGEDMEQGSQTPKVIRTRTMSIKPLSLDEAVMQMDLLNQEFLVFRSAETERINVLYRRPDGDYNLVEPED